MSSPEYRREAAPVIAAGHQRPPGGRPRAGVALAVAAALAAAAQSPAAQAQDGRDAARAAAPVHLQLAIADWAGPTAGADGGWCALSGPVVHVFRDESGRVRDGDVLAFRVRCAADGTDKPDGDTVWTLDELAPGRVAELFLTGAEDAYDIAGEGVLILDAATPEPALKVLKHG